MRRCWKGSPTGPVEGWTWGNAAVHTRSHDRDGRLSRQSLADEARSLDCDPVVNIVQIEGTDTSTYVPQAHDVAAMN